MKPVVKHFLHSLIFLSMVVASLLLLSLFFFPKDNTSGAGMQELRANGILGEPDNTIDVLILGDSESFSTFIPMQIWEQHGITSYCCGTAAQALPYSLDFLKKAFEKQSPKVVILETNTIFRPISLAKLVEQQLDLAFPVFTYHNRWKSLREEDFHFAVNYTYMENSKGYRFSTKCEPANTKNYMVPSNQIAMIPKKNRYYIDQMKEYCDARGSRLILVSTPSPVNWNMPRHNSIQKLSQALHVDYQDLNLMEKEIPIDWKHDTRDKGDHLNYYGAKKTTAYIGRYLAGLGILTDHKNDPQFSHWDKALKKHNRMLSKANVEKGK